MGQLRGFYNEYAYEGSSGGSWWIFCPIGIGYEDAALLEEVISDIGIKTASTALENYTRQQQKRIRKRRSKRRRYSFDASSEREKRMKAKQEQPDALSICHGLLPLPSVQHHRTRHVNSRLI